MENNNIPPLPPKTKKRAQKKKNIPSYTPLFNKDGRTPYIEAQRRLEDFFAPPKNNVQ